METVPWHHEYASREHIGTKDFVAFADRMGEVARHQHVMANVTIRTDPRPGAKIKYQTVGQRDRGETPTTAGDLTTCTETMVIGWYHIWSERQGVGTSDSNCVYEIVRRNVSVTLEESRG
jgi:hypothetical protein